MSKKVLILCGDYVEDYEVMVPFQAMQSIGYTVHAVCPDKKAGDYIMTAIHDFEGQQTYSEKPGHRFTINANFDDVAVANYDGLMIPGGRSPEYLRLNPKVIAITREFAEAGKPIAAVCHGAQILAAVPGILRGKRISAYPVCQPEIELAGGTFADIPVDAAVTDGQYVTAPAWPANQVLLSQFYALLGTRIG